MFNEVSQLIEEKLYLKTPSPLTIEAHVLDLGRPEIQIAEVVLLMLSSQCRPSRVARNHFFQGSTLFFGFDKATLAARKDLEDRKSLHVMPPGRGPGVWPMPMRWKFDRLEVREPIKNIPTF